MLTPLTDLQDCSLESIRPPLHNPGDRERGRTTSPLPVCGLATHACLERDDIPRQSSKRLSHL